MPVTTRKSYQQEQQLNQSKTLSSVVNETTILDQTITVDSVVPPTIEITGTMNIDRSDLEVFPFEGTFYDSYESPNIKLSGEHGHTIDLFSSDIERENAMAYLMDQQHLVKMALFEQSTCMLSPPPSECDPCSPAARARSASVESFVPSPFAASEPASPEQQDAALDILDGIISKEQPQAVTYVAPVAEQQQDFLDMADELIASQAPIDFDVELENVLDFISSQMGPRDMCTQEQDGLKAAVASQEVFDSQAYPSFPLIADTAAEEALQTTHTIADADLDEILSFIDESKQTCASPAHSVASAFSGTTAASPAHSATSDEDYVPVAELKRKNGIGGNKRGRKRKVDADFGEDSAEAKKLKNAAAAARYREKKRLEDLKATEELEQATDQVQKTRDEFNKMLKKRNFFLEFLFEENKKKPEHLQLKFPSWVENYLKLVEN